MHPVVGFLLVVLQAAAPTMRGARNPSYAADGRLALSVYGRLWVRSADSSPRWLRITAGPAWDREPAWTADGAALVFSSDRAGGFDLWKVRIGPEGMLGEPERLTTSPEPEGEPTVGADGSIAFVRGRDATARLWLRAADGTERRLTKAESPEGWPAFSPDGKRIAYISLGESANRLRIYTLAGGRDTVVVGDRNAEHPAWSPSGTRLVFATGGTTGVLVTSADGRYVNLVSTRHAEPAWSPDGKTLALAELPPDEPSYNGDPDRVADRDRGESLSGEGRLWFVAAPAEPDAGLAEQPLAAQPSREAWNAEEFDRVWSRSAELYYTGATARRAEWESLRARFRPRALAAANEGELQRVIHELLRQRPPLGEEASGRAAVSSAHPVATAAGLEILSKGGNVVDAAAAVSFALGVVEPDASGVGGYGQMLLFTPAMSQPTLIEFMTRVPEDATLGNGSLLQDGRYPPDGPVLANVPGTVAAMHLAWKKYGSGKVAWAEVLAPAVRAARDGYLVSEGLATTLDRERAHFLKYEGSRALFFRNGQPLQAGDTLKNPDLAWTLEQIAKGGADAFYKGDVARRIVGDLRGKGNAMKLTDLARYYAAEREPVAGTYRGYALYSSAPPVAGGASLVATLNLLEHWKDPKPYAEDAATLHAMIAAWQLVPSTRNRIADPGLWPVDLGPFTSKDTAAARWRCFDLEQALAPALLRTDSLPCARAPNPATTGDEAPSDAPHAAGTTAFTVADADGNVVAVTQTLGTWGGNFYVSPGLGFLYNDKLTSYGSDPSAYGARLPYARHGSTLAPTIVLKGEGAARRPVLAVGAAGNAWITAAVYQTLTGMLDQKLGPQRALELPRFLLAGQRSVQGRRESVIEMEDGFAPEVIDRLKRLGYLISFISLPGELRMGYGAAVRIGAKEVTAGADPRRAGAAGAVK